MFRYFKRKKQLKELEEYLHFQLISNGKGNACIEMGLIDSKHSLIPAKFNINRSFESPHVKVEIVLNGDVVISQWIYITNENWKNDIKNTIDNYYEDLYLKHLKHNIDSNLEELSKVLHFLKYDVEEIYKKSKLARFWRDDLNVELGYSCNLDEYLKSVMIHVKLKHDIINVNHPENLFIPITTFDFNRKGNFELNFDDMSEYIKAQVTEVLNIN